MKGYRALTGDFAAQRTRKEHEGSASYSEVVNNIVTRIEKPICVLDANT